MDPIPPNEKQPALTDAEKKRSESNRQTALKRLRSKSVWIKTGSKELTNVEKTRAEKNRQVALKRLTGKTQSMDSKLTSTASNILIDCTDSSLSPSVGKWKLLNALGMNLRNDLNKCW